jgi:GalNAc-alpha-(1->4)-GalNAc-alpha-(1->3)-diNAcBac-PP-undecaprenol alpha-1,4-N-acetyl-D-galactosaminyltransferase
MRRLRKIVFVVFSLRGGGAERVVTRLSDALRHHVEVTIVQLSSVKPFYTLPQDVKLVSYPGPENGQLRYLAVARYLFGALRAEKADVVVSFGETINPFVILIGRLARQTVMVANRASPLSSLRGRRAWLNPVMYRHAAAIIVQTHRAVELLSRRYQHQRWIVSENPLPVPPAVPRDVDRENLCLTVGYLGWQKNQRQVIESFVRVSPPEWRLVVVGDGPDRAMLEDVVERLGGGDRVRFAGAVKDVDTLLRRAKVFAFASLSEGFPNALAEAMVQGCACIAIDCPTGPAELIDHGRSGLLVPASDPAAFDAGLAQLMTSSSLRESLAREARERAGRLDARRVATCLLRDIEKSLERDQRAIGSVSST